MTGPNPGFYSLQNIQSHGIITAQTNSGISMPGEIVKTDRDANSLFPEQSKLVVSQSSDGLYSFRNLSTRMWIGTGLDKDGNPAVVWTMAQHLWNVEPVGPGYWSISVPGATDSFWYDNVVVGDTCSEILLKGDKTLVQCKWFFIAA
ncbi:hypothetical protein CVT24_008745 [Panaeolus cyanescens]|uniref:Ricin B lectin domain-containing protein n=1 Tax=Panaeolus cyanescens TaxID=181874 RepID=A0A409WEF7_9AGAR|nr:hypothetical protein CVT24_008745 [Panaeolus cyanescens]